MATARKFALGDLCATHGNLDLVTPGYVTLGVSLWFKITSLTGIQAFMACGSPVNFQWFWNGSANTAVNIFGTLVVLGPAITVGVWHHLCGSFTAQSGVNPNQGAWRDAIALTDAGAFNASLQTFPNNRFWLGSQDGADDGPFIGSLAQLAIWADTGTSPLLTSGNATSLAGGALPSVINPSKLIQYVLIDGNSGPSGSEFDLVSSTQWDTFGTTQDLNGPPVGADESEFMDCRSMGMGSYPA